MSKKVTLILALATMLIAGVIIAIPASGFSLLFWQSANEPTPMDQCYIGDTWKYDDLIAVSIVDDCQYNMTGTVKLKNTNEKMFMNFRRTGAVTCGLINGDQDDIVFSGDFKMKHGDIVIKLRTDHYDILPEKIVLKKVD